MGSSERQAQVAFAKAAIASMNNPLALNVIMKRDIEVIARVSVEH